MTQVTRCNQGMSTMTVVSVKISTSYRRTVVDMFCAADQMEKEMFTSLKMDFV